MGRTVGHAYAPVVKFYYMMTRWEQMAPTMYWQVCGEFVKSSWGMSSGISDGEALETYLCRTHLY